MTDEAIVALYFSRNERAIQESSNKYSRFLLSIAENILRRREDAEECENSTYLQAWNSIPPQKPDRLGAYLGKITRNLALQTLRMQNAERRGGKEATISLDELALCLPDTDSTEEAFDAALLAEALNRFLMTLGKTARQIFVLRYWYCMAIGEIAKIFSCKESRIKMSLLRSRQKLLAYLEKEGFEQ